MVRNMSERNYQIALDTGGVLTHHRIRAGLSQKQLSEAAVVDPSTVSKIESGDRAMSLTTFVLLGAVLGVRWEADTLRVVEDVIFER